MIRVWRPWERSTGPTSPEGKAKASRNAYAGGEGAKLRQTIKELKQALRQQREWLG